MHYAKFKKDTKEYREFKSDIHHLLAERTYDFDSEDKFKLSLVVGYSSKLSDLDNAFKPLLDSMQLAMGFDDRQVFEIEALKDHTKKGDEYIMVRLEKITDNQWKRRLKGLFPMFTKEKI
jgi:Holliday junction resolvase RusA-like endonuclease|tara:strand:- start:256 stop:615 length:360 start_codon:yes stop_codon:yes gene_type:complete